MQRYPALAVYRGILLIGGWLTIFGGVLFVVSVSSRSYYGFNLGEFLLGSIPFIVGGGALIVISEIISLFVNIETRLIEIRDVNQQMARGGKSESRSSAPVATPLSSSSSAPAPAQPKPDTSALEQLARGQRVRFEGVVTAERAVLRVQPSRQSSALRAVTLGQEVGVMAQNTDGAWLLVMFEGKPYWTLTEGVSTDGDTSTLPVVS